MKALKKRLNKYLILASTDQSKEVLTKYTELWNKIKKLIQKINGKSGAYDEKYMKIKFDLDDNLLLNEILKLHNLTKVVRFAF